MAPIFGFTARDIIAEGRIEKLEIYDIRSWLFTQEDIPKLSDEQIVHFLLSCNRNKGATQRTIKEHFKIKRAAPQFFVRRSMDKDHIQRALRSS